MKTNEIVELKSFNADFKADNNERRSHFGKEFHTKQVEGEIKYIEARMKIKSIQQREMREGKNKIQRVEYKENKDLKGQRQKRKKSKVFNARRGEKIERDVYEGKKNPKS